MKKKLLMVVIILTPLAFSCNKDDVELEWNNIVINNVSTSYVQADDCTASGGTVGTNFTFSVDFSNPKNEEIDYLELDVLYDSGNAYYSFNYPNFNINGNVLTHDVCRPFFGQDFFDIRVFIVTKDGLRSKPKTYRLHKPE